MIFDRCPSQSELSELAAKPHGGPLVAHLARCGKCREQFEHMCDDERLLKELRQAAEEDPLDERFHQRILQRCFEVARRQGDVEPIHKPQIEP